jgi:hypothetical protein
MLNEVAKAIEAEAGYMGDRSIRIARVALTEAKAIADRLGDEKASVFLQAILTDG